MSYHLRWFASLADRAGRDAETVTSNATTPEALYEEMTERHDFALAAARLRVAVNGRFVGWRKPLSDGDEVVFVPPVSGG